MVIICDETNASAARLHKNHIVTNYNKYSSRCAGVKRLVVCGNVHVCGRNCDKLRKSYGDHAFRESEDGLFAAIISRSFY